MKRRQFSLQLAGTGAVVAAAPFAPWAHAANEPVEGRDYEIRGTVTEAIEGEGIKGEAGRIGAGAGVGAIIGGILGGFKGALAGILIGGGGVIAATEGKEVELPQGTLLRVRIDSPVSLDPLRR